MLDLIRVKSKRARLEIGANRKDENSPWEGYVQLDDGYFDNEEGRRAEDLHKKEAKEFADSLNSKGL